MLSKKLQKLNNIDLGKTYNAEKLTTGLCKLINMLRDLMKLALDHKIEEHLYYGDGLVKVYQLIGDRRTTKFLSTIYEENLQQKEVWEKLVLFLDKENKIHQQKMLLNYKSDARRDKNFPPKQLPPKNSHTLHHATRRHNKVIQLATSVVQQMLIMLQLLDLVDQKSSNTSRVKNLSTQHQLYVSRCFETRTSASNVYFLEQMLLQENTPKDDANATLYALIPRTQSIL